MLANKAASIIAFASLGMALPNSIHNLGARDDLNTKISIRNSGFPGGGTGSPSCIPTCVVTIHDFYDCAVGTADFLGECAQRDGIVTRPLSGCKGYSVTWEVTGSNGKGYVNVNEKATSYTWSWDIETCALSDGLDAASSPFSGQQCAFGGGCEIL